MAGDDWDSLITHHENHSVFHRAAWARILAETYGHKPIYLCIQKDREDIALLPLMELKSMLSGNRAVSLPFSDFAGPLWRKQGMQSEVYDYLTQMAVGKNWKYLEIREEENAQDLVPSFQVYDGHELDLRDGIESVERNLNPSVRRAIRKAEKSGLKVSVEGGEEDIRIFYRLHEMTRRRHGLPPQPFSFFRSIGDHLLKKGMGFVALGRLEGVPVAGAVFLHSRSRAIYKFGASDTAHWSLRPNQLVMWGAIQHLVASGSHRLHFGRTSRHDDGLNRFKLSWGAASRSVHYTRYNVTSRNWVAPVPMRAEGHPLIFGHLPAALNRIAGKMIYPHLD
ncbi:MAG: GNAT family N-acetyltransferase [Proteobacteria bacterium]|nr:MAG: GNAT family N-acetyltransferase [Pseudomonadota bacterium]